MDKFKQLTGTKIEYMPLDAIRVYDNNPKKHPKKQIAKIKLSIQKFGFNQPIIVDKNNIIIAGHGRYLAARELRLKDIPILRIEHLNEKEIKLYRIMDNKSAESSWDKQKLLSELSTVINNPKDVVLSGYEEVDISKMLMQIQMEEDKIENILKQFVVAPAYKLKSKSLFNIERYKDIQKIQDVMELLKPTNEEWALIKNKKYIIIEYSGGKDSTAAVLWAKYFLGDRDIRLLYGDLGVEFPGILQYIIESAEKLNLELHIQHTQKSLIEIFLEKGKWPSFRGPYCHNVLHEILDEFVMQYDAQQTMVIRGGRLAESQKKQTKGERILKLTKMPRYIYYQLVYFAKKDLCNIILEKSQLSLWSGYKKGLLRTCCRICPGQRPQVYAILRTQFPMIWDEILWLERRIKGIPWWPSHNSSFSELADFGEQQLIVKQEVNHGNDISI